MSREQACAFELHQFCGRRPETGVPLTQINGDRRPPCDTGL